jgi:hypothetical protein
MTIIATYHELNQAETAVDKLSDSGIEKNKIGLATLNETYQNAHQKHKSTPNEMVAEATGATATGGMVGAAAGFILGALGIATGFGALLISGPLALVLGGSALAANTAVGAGIGALGGFVSGLTSAGVKEAEAQEMARTIEKGGVMISVDLSGSDNRYSDVENILKSTNPTQIVHIG